MTKRKPKTPPVTRLLVSVKNAAEALVAVDNGAHLIDVKDPSRGSLGAASPEIWREVMAAVQNRATVSAALGELREDPVLDLVDQSKGLSFVKVGMKGCTNPPDYDWRIHWYNWVSHLPFRTRCALVVYADWRDCGAPAPQDLLKCVREIRPPAVLVDTCDKLNGTLREHCSDEQLVRFIQAARKANPKILIAIAGSLQLSDLPELLPLGPDIIAVRGGVCSGPRDGRLDGALVREWAQALSISRK